MYICKLLKFKILNLKLEIMKITNDEKGIIRLISSEGLSEDVRARILKRLAKKKETLESMKVEMQSGKYSDLIATL